MWKIQRLYLKNFIHIYAGLGKEEITLDFHECDKVINIFVGKMGSGKSSILGHLQPFATYGTLDIRNQDDPIQIEKDGVKEIDFQHDEDIYTIQHQYKWNKYSKSHNIKSYIQLNGTELNPNGNSSSFKEIIRTYFGIEQNFLRLLRLGPNVANVINMKAAERKSFIASLLSDAEVYTMLFKHLSDDLKVVHATLSALSKKLINLSSTDEDQMKAELGDMIEDFKKAKEKLDGVQTEFFRQKGMLSNSLQGSTLEELTAKYSQLREHEQSLKAQIAEKQEILNSIQTERSLPDVMREIGALESEIKNLHLDCTRKDELLKEKSIEVEKKRSILEIHGSSEHLEDLRTQVKELQERVDRQSNILRGFKSPYTYHYLKGISDRLPMIKHEIEEIATYQPKTISTLYHSDSGIASFASKKIDMLNGRLYNLQKQVSNIRYAAEYRQMYPMYRPPLCPTIDCPYYQTHPVTIQNTGINLEENEVLQKLLSEITEVNRRIAEYQEYPILVQRIQLLKASWKEITPILQHMGVLQYSSLYDVLVNFSHRMNWYHHGKFVDFMESCKIQEENLNLVTQLEVAKKELRELEEICGSNLEEQIAKAEQERDIVRQDIQTLLDTIDEKESLYNEKNQLYAKMRDQSSLQSQLEELLSEERDLGKELQELAERVDTADSISSSLTSLTMQVNTFNQKVKELGDSIAALNLKLMDINYTKNEFAEATREREEIKTILEAVSTKEGIPLIMVKVFLNDARGILNELLEDVFSDHLEILPFNISESEFKIPYSIDGWVVDDIDTASQGQQAIISIALSFALLRKALFEYNIMLLDEIDGPLYKKDRDRFLNILFKQLQAIGASQVFLITHNNTFENNPVNIILTTDELVDENANHSIMRLY